MTYSKAAVWFRRVMWLGILANLALAIPAMIAPDRMIAMTGLPPASPLLWVRFSGVALLLLSLFYMPPAINPYRYRATAWLALVSRLAGVLFFATQAAEYRMFGLFDLTFLVPEAILLTMAFRNAPAGEWRVEGAAP